MTEHGGVMPTANDIVAALVVFFVYVTRFGLISEGGRAPCFLVVTTDFVLPVLAGAWLLVVPAWQVWRRG